MPKQGIYTTLRTEVHSRTGEKELAMAEPAEPTVEPTEPAATEPHGTEPSKEETDWKAEARKWEARAKENKGAADKLKEFEDAQLSELEKAQKEAEDAKAEAAKLKADKDRTDAIKAAAKAAEVDEELLGLMVGDTAEEIAANAEVLKAKIAEMPAYPSVEDNGSLPTPAITKEQIDQIKDPVERVKMRAANLGLYK